MLIAVLMIFTIFSFTGVAVLNVSYLSSNSSMETINNIKLQYATESSINEALWRINRGVDSLVNSNADGIATIWNPELKTLSVNVDKFQMESEILLDLSDDTHFDRGIAAEETVDLDGYESGLDDDHQVRGNFEFLPEADVQYFLDNAVEVHTQSWHVWSDDTLSDGIHVFTGNWIAIENITLNGTLVFTGHHVSMRYGNQITAAAGDTSSTEAALVFTNEYQDFEAYSPDDDESIIGAIYCKGNISLRNGYVSGPVIGRNVTLHGNFDFHDTDHNDRFRWTKGFGHRHSYDWPKQIGRWKTNKWIKKHHV